MAAESEAKKPGELKRVNMTTLFDLLDDIWGYLERCESRTRYFGKLNDIHKEEFVSIRARIAEARLLLHPRPVSDEVRADGKSTDD